MHGARRLSNPDRSSGRRDICEPLVTGANGFIGRWLVGELTARGAEVAAADRGDCELTDGPGVGDLVRRAAPDVVFHLAAQSSVKQSFDEILPTYMTNVVGTVAVLEAVRRHAARVRVVVTSTAEVYGAVASDEAPIPESAPVRPLSPYGASKAAQEIAALQFARCYGSDVVVTRGFTTTGPGQSPTYALASFARQLARVRLGGVEPVLKVGNLAPVRDVIDVRDAVAALILVAERGSGGEIYNMCRGSGVSIGDALALLVEVSGVRVDVREDPERFRPADVPVLVGSNRKLRGATGWEPRIPLSTTLRELFEQACHDAARGHETA